MIDHAQYLDDLVDQANANDPTMDGWGMYFYCDVGAACGGGQGGFYWFANKAELLEMAKYVSWIFPPFQGDNDLELLEENHELIQRVISDEITLEDARIKLNEALAGLIQVSWWGRVPELLDGDGEELKVIRSYYWSQFAEEVEDEDNFTPIPPDHQVEFLKFVKEFV
ncbi:MAG: hypothetical protein CL609_24165 [Anaerolineaceae bacterium]|nr:hypothetical protein [Anaerolineaceae bacterium]